MKKFLLLIFCAALSLCLAACGASEPEAAPEPTPEEALLEPVEATPTPQELEAASATTAEELAGEEMPASATDAALDEDAFAAAEECVGRTAEELYDAIGEPTGDVRYASSCLEENAEDGMLFYDELGFYVWTVRSESGEIVHAVYPLD